MDTKQQHTEEPWQWRAQGDANHYCMLTHDGKWVIAFLQNGEMLTVEQEANARRIVACVNACAGIETEALEGLPRPFGDLLSKPFVPKARRGFYEIDERAELQEQRDKLLAAAKFAVSRLADFNGTDTEETRRMLVAAQQKLFEAVKTTDPAYYGLKAAE